MKKIDTPSEKARITMAIKAFLSAKAAADAAKRVKDEAQAVLMSMLDGDAKAEWNSEGTEYALTATYGKTRSTLDKGLVEKVLGVVVKPECYKISAPWDELRIKVIG